MPRATRSRTGLTTKGALAILVLILTAAAILEWRGGGGEDARLATHIQRDAGDPIDLIASGMRAHRLVFLADVAGSVAAKRFAVRVLEAVADDPGLDAVALPIDAELQSVIDRYLDSDPEDAAILLGRPRTLREWEGTGRPFLDIYRTVWRLNRELGADRRIRILAIDMPGWPTEPGSSPSHVARLYGVRDSAMAEQIEERLLRREPRARVLFFMDALHGLKTGGAHVQTGGAGRVETRWLAARLREQHPGEVFTILVDAPASRAVAADIAAYRGTRLLEALRRAGATGRLGIRVGEEFDFMIRPVRAASAPGVSVDLVPHDYRLRDVADVYVFLDT